jgi:hypothetical protein
MANDFQIAYWVKQIAAWQASQLSQAAFCRREGISLHSFRAWLYQPDRRRARHDWQVRQHQAGPSNAAPTFVELRVAGEPTAAEALAPVAGTLEVVLRNGRRIAVAPGFDDGTLRQLLRLLEDPSC